MTKKNQQPGAKKASSPSKNKTAKKKLAEKISTVKASAKKKNAKKAAPNKVASRKKPVKNKISAKEIDRVRDLKSDSEISETKITISAADPVSTVKETVVADQKIDNVGTGAKTTVENSRKPQMPDQLLAATRSESKRSFWLSLAMLLVLFVVGAGFARYWTADKTEQVAQVPHTQNRNEEALQASSSVADTAATSATEKSGFVDTAAAFFTINYQKAKSYLGGGEESSQTVAQQETNVAVDETFESVFARLWNGIKGLTTGNKADVVKPDSSVVSKQGEDESYFTSAVNRFKSWTSIGDGKTAPVEATESAVVDIPRQLNTKDEAIQTQVLKEASDYSAPENTSGEPVSQMTVPNHSISNAPVNTIPAENYAANNPAYQLPVQAYPATPQNGFVDTRYNPYAQSGYWNYRYRPAPYPIYYAPYSYNPYYAPMPQQGVNSVNQ